MGENCNCSRHENGCAVTVRGGGAISTILAPHCGHGQLS